MSDLETLLRDEWQITLTYEHESVTATATRGIERCEFLADTLDEVLGRLLDRLLPVKEVL